MGVKVSLFCAWAPFCIPVASQHTATNAIVVPHPFRTNGLSPLWLLSVLRAGAGNGQESLAGLQH
jgi:hypothetical protein